MSKTKPVWWPKNPYPKSIFPMTSKEYVAAIPDEDLRTAISGLLSRRAWGMASGQIQGALEKRNELLEEYLVLDYCIVIEPFRKEDGGGWEAHIPILGRSTCVGVGDTPGEALESVLECKRSLFEMWLDEGLPIPVPEFENTLDGE